MAEWTGSGDLRPARAIVFDKDGVLVDFAALWLPVVRARASAIAQASGLDEAATIELGAMLGLVDGRIDPQGPLVMATRADALAIASSFLYRRGHGWLEAKAIAEAAFQQADEAAHDRLRPTGELLPALDQLKALGLKLAVATTDLTAHARRDLDRLGILDRFGAIVGADAVPQSKPHPDMFLKACELLGVPPAEAWMVGDAAADLLMARAAGAAGAIAVASGVGSPDLLAPLADALVAGVWSLPAAIAPGEIQPSVDPTAWYTLYSDGAARGNPGPAALGAVVMAADGRVLLEASEALGIATNNVAEYQALLRGVMEARALGIRKLVVRADSELLIRQLKGEYAVKSDHLRPLYRRAIDALKSLEAYRLEHVRREANRHADALANRALDLG